MIGDRPRLELPQEPNIRLNLRKVRPFLWVAFPVLLLTYPYLMGGMAFLIWGSSPTQVPGKVRAFRIPKDATTENIQDSFPGHWSANTEIFVDRENSDAIYVFPYSGRFATSNGKPAPIFRLNLKTGSIDRLSNPDPLGFVSTRCEAFRSLVRDTIQGPFNLGHSFSGMSLPVFVGPNLLLGSGWRGGFRRFNWGRDRITLRLGHEALPMGDVPILGSTGTSPDIVEAFQDPSRRVVILVADEWLVVMKPEWITKLPGYPWAAIHVSNPDWHAGSMNSGRQGTLSMVDGRWVVRDSIILDGSVFPLREVALRVTPPAGFNFSNPEPESFEVPDPSGTPHHPREGVASEVTWRDIPDGRVFTISRMPYGGDRLTIPIRLQGPVVTQKALPLDPYCSVQNVEHPGIVNWLFQAGKISFIQGPGEAPPPALEGEPWFNWHCDLPLNSGREVPHAPDRRGGRGWTGMGVVGGKAR